MLLTTNNWNCECEYGLITLMGRSDEQKEANNYNAIHQTLRMRLQEKNISTSISTTQLKEFIMNLELLLN